MLSKDPKNGFAKVHMGFIVKTGDRDYAGAIPLLQEGIASNVTGVIDGRFFFHLGDALFRTGQEDEVIETVVSKRLSCLLRPWTLLCSWQVHWV